MDISGLGAPTGSHTTTRGFNDLKSEDFFGLLIAQLQAQDPMKPTSNEQLLQQISSIKNIEQSNTLNTTLGSLASEQRFGATSGLIGHYVAGTVRGQSGNPTELQGVVIGVRFEGGNAILELHNGRSLPAEAVEQVTLVENLPPEILEQLQQELGQLPGGSPETSGDDSEKSILQSLSAPKPTATPRSKQISAASFQPRGSGTSSVLASLISPDVGMSAGSLSDAVDFQRHERSIFFKYYQHHRHYQGDLDMGLTSALFTGLSGLNTSQFRLDIIGDNIANINTTGFKGSRTLFQSQFSRTLAAGTKPNGTQGGTNPMQIGLGSTVGTIQRSFTAGSVETTGVPSDLAIEGDGFFVLRTPENENVYTRDGSFTLSADKRLVTADGFFVQGYGINSDFEIVPGAIGDLSIPIGSLTTARATESAELEGTLNSSGDVATQGTILQSGILYNFSTSAQLNNVTGPGMALTNIAGSAGGPALFNNGDVITIDGIKRGGRDVPPEQFVVGTTGTTIADFLGWMDEVTGIDTTAGVGGSPGTGVTADGRLEIRGNVGTENAMEIPDGSLTSSNGTTQLPFSFTQTQEANGESAHTTFVVYDSLGKPISVDLTMVLEQKGTGSSIWRYYATAADDTDVDFSVGTGTLEFNSSGQFLQSPQNGIVINRVNSGASDPLAVQLDFSRLSGLTTTNSSLVMSFQDGFSTGTLIDFNVGQDGIITGTFTNGLNQVLGQLSLATFANSSGLLARSNNVYFVGPNSGEARVGPPLTLGSGKITAGALELSNVDLSREFINLITSSTAFSAASRVVSTSDQLLQELLLIARR